MKTLFFVFVITVPFLFGISGISESHNESVKAVSVVFEFPDYNSSIDIANCTCATTCFGVSCCKTCPSAETCTCSCLGFRNCSCSACAAPPDEKINNNIRKEKVLQASPSYSLSEKGYLELRNFAVYLYELQDEKTIAIAHSIAKAVEVLATQDFSSYEKAASVFHDQLRELPKDLKLEVNRYLNENGAPETYLI